jgi:hypothetical protein
MQLERSLLFPGTPRPAPVPERSARPVLTASVSRTAVPPGERALVLVRAMVRSDRPASPPCGLSDSRGTIGATPSSSPCSFHSPAPGSSKFTTPLGEVRSAAATAASKFDTIPSRRAKAQGGGRRGGRRGGRGDISDDKNDDKNDDDGDPEKERRRRPRAAAPPVADHAGVHERPRAAVVVCIPPLVAGYTAGNEARETAFHAARAIEAQAPETMIAIADAEADGELYEFDGGQSTRRSADAFLRSRGGSSDTPASAARRGASHTALKPLDLPPFDPSAEGCGGMADSDDGDPEADDDDDDDDDDDGFNSPPTPRAGALDPSKWLSTALEAARAADVPVRVVIVAAPTGYAAMCLEAVQSLPPGPNVDAGQGAIPIHFFGDATELTASGLTPLVTLGDIVDIPPLQPRGARSRSGGSDGPLAVPAPSRTGDTGKTKKTMMMMMGNESSCFCPGDAGDRHARIAAAVTRALVPVGHAMTLRCDAAPGFIIHAVDVAVVAAGAGGGGAPCALATHPLGDDGVAAATVRVPDLLPGRELVATFHVSVPVSTRAIAAATQQVCQLTLRHAQCAQWPRLWTGPTTSRTIDITIARPAAEAGGVRAVKRQPASPLRVNLTSPRLPTNQSRDRDRWFTPPRSPRVLQ